jgi:hypothetical protein
MVFYSKAYRKRVSDAARIRGKRSALVTRERCLRQEIDADTLMQRARYDRRGTLYAEIRKPTEAGMMTFTVRWSVNGRTDQLDIFDASQIIATCRPSLVFAKLP